MTALEALIAVICILAIVCTLVGAGAALVSQIRLWRRERREMLLRWIRAQLQGLFNRNVQ